MEPGILFHPFIGLSILQKVRKHLFEQTKMIIQADTIPREAKRCNGIQKACCQTPKTTISQRWFRFYLLDFGKLFSVCSQYFFHFGINPQIDQVVGKQFSDKKFC